MRELSCGQDVANVEVVMVCSFPCCQDCVSANSRFCLICCWSDAKPLLSLVFCENTNYSWTVQELRVILESQNGLNWKGPLKRSSLTPLSSLGEVQSSIQPDLEGFQGWALTPSSGKSHCKEFFSYIQSKSILFQFKTVVPCPVVEDLGKRSLSIFPVSPLDLLSGHKNISPTDQPWISQPFITAEAFQPSEHFVPPLDPP